MESYARDVRHGTLRVLSSGSDAGAEDLDAWRWRNYTDHLIDLGYELNGDKSDRWQEPVTTVT